MSGTLALAVTLCLWWLYFRGELIAQRHVAATEDRIYAVRIGANGLLLMIAGLIVLAAGNALVVDRPSREASLALVLMLFGGPAVFLVARIWYQRRVFAWGGIRRYLGGRGTSDRRSGPTLRMRPRGCDSR